jgi:exosortase A-associated hydrolase 1
MRRMINFACEGTMLAGTLDLGDKSTALLIVSGGNEIRCGSHNGQAAMAAHFAALGYPVLRFDRRGIGDSEGDNGGFESSAPDLTAAILALQEHLPHVARIVGFGNCDAASALALYHAGLGIDQLVLANPWVIESPVEQSESSPKPSAAAIRARYWLRLKNPRSLVDLFSGKINLRKLVGGLARATQSHAPSGLAARMARALDNSQTPVALLIAERDSTAMAFMADWKAPLFTAVRQRPDVTLARLDSASHSFAEANAKSWLLDRVGFVLRSQEAD